MRTVLFTNNKREGYLDLLIPKEEIKKTIYQHPEFTAYKTEIEKVFNKWKAAVKPELEAIAIGDKPKAIIRNISENLLKRFTGLRLIDKYDIYQHLMTYWADTMQDDVYTLVADGWNAGRTVESQEKKKDWDGLLIPKSIMINEYFQEEQEEIDSLTANRDELTLQLTELEEEHGGDEGYFSILDKVNKANVAKRLKEIKKDKSAKDEIKVLKTYLDLSEKQTELNGELKVALQELDEALLEKYTALTETEIKELVINRKWMNTIEKAVTSELESISQRLTQRIKELAERYETPLPMQTEEVATLEEKVNAHLQKMGFIWR